MDRIELLRDKALNHIPCGDEFLYLFYKRYSESEYISDFKKYSDAFYYVFSNLTPCISEGELIVGELKTNLTETQKDEWERVYRARAENMFIMSGDGQDSHMSIDYELLLKSGISGIVSQIDKYIQCCEKEKLDFYDAARTCLLAVVEHSNKYAEFAERLAAIEGSETRKKELYEIARICKKVPYYSAESFYEAVQSVHFVTYCLSWNPLRRWAQQFQLGHPDRYLLPFYQKDIANNMISKERAQLLLDCLGIQINMRVPSGLSSGYMVGGRDEKGNIVSNELTEMLMNVIDDIGLVYPAVGLCYTQGMPDAILEKACRILAKGRTHPAIFNDDIITKGLVSYGVPSDEAHNYIHSTCVEITPVSSSNAWVASPYTNMAQLLLDTMSREYNSLDMHIEAIFNKIDKTIEANFLEQSRLRRQREKNSMNPLLSCFVNDCLSSGRDIERGGARYNWIMPSFVGMANLVDSLYVLKAVVYDSKEYTIKEIKEILDSNFSGHELLRRRIFMDIPKYGNDVDDVDRYFGLFTEHIVSECKKYVGEFNSSLLIPSAFCWEMHERFGRETGATPDGRLAGFPLGDGSGPCQGREMNGPTASILSSTTWEHYKFIGGVAVNMKFSRSSLGKGSLGVIQALVKSYMRLGGFELQVNVTDRQLLEKACKNPEEYRDLIVRIGGYSDYFTRLSPEMQQEIILRTEHRI